ncbi:MAG: oligosaccharide flippase family protein [Synechococcales bacterium]|nr:oligosaccharide flippase family protein [Synechococcales bacterium]
MTTLKSLATRGAAWTIFGYGSSQVLRLGSNIVLTRLLVPEFFGLMAIVNTLRMGLMLFSDVGVNQSIIQSPHGDDPNFLRTAWTLQGLRGIGIWLICLILAYPIAQFYGEPQFVWVIPIIGFTAVLDGFNSTSLYTLNRHLDLGQVTRLELASFICSIVVMIGWAWVSPTIWALVSGSFASSLFMLVASHWSLPGIRHRFSWHQDALKDLFNFGKWVFLATTMLFLAEQADRLILGKLLSLEMLGIYTIAFTLSNVPRAVIKRLSNKVIFPTISRQADLPRVQLREKILRQRRKLLLGLALLVSMAVCVGDVAIEILYDDRYLPATWMMPILCVGVWFAVLVYTTNPALMGIGKPIYSAYSNIVRFGAIAMGIPLGYQIAGILGAVLMVALSDIPPFLTLTLGLQREKMSFLRQDIWATAAFLACLAALLSLRYALGFGLPIEALYNG